MTQVKGRNDPAAIAERIWAAIGPEMKTIHVVGSDPEHLVVVLEDADGRALETFHDVPFEALRIIEGKDPRPADDPTRTGWLERMQQTMYAAPATRELVVGMGYDTATRKFSATIFPNGGGDDLATIEGDRDRMMVFAKAIVDELATLMGSEPEAGGDTALKMLAMAVYVAEREERLAREAAGEAA